MDFLTLNIQLDLSSSLAANYALLEEKFLISEAFVFCDNGESWLFVTGKELPEAEQLIRAFSAACKSHSSLKSPLTQQWRGKEGAARFLEEVIGIASDTTRLQLFHEQFQSATAKGYPGLLLQHLFRQGILLHEKARQKSGYFDFAISVDAIVRELCGKVLGHLENRYIGQFGYHEAFPSIIDLFAQHGQKSLFHQPALLSEKDEMSRLKHVDILLVGDSPNRHVLDLLLAEIKKTRRRSFVIFDFGQQLPGADFRRLSNVYFYTPVDLGKIRHLHLSEQKQVAGHIREWIKQALQGFNNLGHGQELSIFSGIAGQSLAMQQVFEQIARIAPSDATVLLDGESGTGKEICATAIHNHSHRAQHLFKTINCGAIPENLLESILFGHVRGAFTGATDTRAGLFESANHGTVFLDEIGEMPGHLQVKLLRFLQSGEIMKVGSNDVTRADVRIIAATNRDLESMVKAGAFRSDLYYRLNVIRMTLPPLRERREDIPLLSRYFLQKFAARFRKNVFHISDDAIRRLQAYNWPGNVRELENALERAVILAIGDQIRPAQLPPAITQHSVLTATTDASLKTVEKQHILNILQACDNNYDLACKQLGISRTTLWRKLREYQVDVSE